MALIVDASVLYAQADVRDPAHEAVVGILRDERGRLVTSQIAVAEADYLIGDRLGVDVELDFIDDLAAGTFTVDCLSREDLALARKIARRHRDLRLGLADASLIVLAGRHRTSRLASLDERAFRVVSPLHGESFTLLPADLT